VLNTEDGIEEGLGVWWIFGYKGNVRVEQGASDSHTALAHSIATESSASHIRTIPTLLQ
jgi:hypothetical protein